MSHPIFSILLDTTRHALPQFDKIRILQPLNDLVRPQMGYGLSRAGASEWGEHRDGRMHAPVPPMRRAAAVLAPRPLLAGAGVGAFAAAVVMLPGLLSCRRWRRRARSCAPG